MIVMLSGPDKRIVFSKDVKKFLNKELKNCNSLVAIAASDCAKKNDDYFNGTDMALGVKGMFNQLDVNIKDYYLLDYRNSLDEMIDIINKSDIIHLMGGDPFKQLEILRKIDCKKLFKNKILIGVSAGSMNMAIKGYYSSDKDYPKTWFYDGIGLVDITIDPHFDINNLEWVNENKKYSYIHEIVGLPNESAIIIDNNDSINYIGEYYVFHDGEIK